MIDPTVPKLIQALPEECRWVVADEWTVKAIRRNEPSERGPRTGLLRIILRLLIILPARIVFLYIIGFLDCLRIYRAHAVAGKSLPEEDSINVFVGFGARAEPAMSANYQVESSRAVIRIDQTKVESMGQFCQVSLFGLLKRLGASCRAVARTMRDLPQDLQSRRLEWLAYVGSRLGIYSFNREWWVAIQKRVSIGEACFVSPDTPAFAAVDSGVSAYFMQHGLLSSSVILPRFDRVLALTEFERRYILSLFPGTTAELVIERPQFPHEEAKPVLFVASGIRPLDEMRLVVPLLEAGHELGLQAVVRPARGEVLADFWEGPEIGHLKSVEVESSDGKFTDALDRNRPMFLASWGSTTLVEALQIGIIPIVVATRNDRWVEDTLYPLLECCLHWPTDEAMIERAVSDRTSYQRTLDDLREKALALN